MMIPMEIHEDVDRIDDMMEIVNRKLELENSISHMWFNAQLVKFRRSMDTADTREEEFVRLIQGNTNLRITFWEIPSKVVFIQDEDPFQVMVWIKGIQVYSGKKFEIFIKWEANYGFEVMIRTGNRIPTRTMSLNVSCFFHGN